MTDAKSMASPGVRIQAKLRRSETSGCCTVHCQSPYKYVGEVVDEVFPATSINCGVEARKKLNRMSRKMFPEVWSKKGMTFESNAVIEFCTRQENREGTGFWPWSSTIYRWDGRTFKRERIN